jgi:hypothetical protein
MCSPCRRRRDLPRITETHPVQVMQNGHTVIETLSTSAR